MNSYIIKGDVKNLEAELLGDINLSKVNLSFIADKDDILIKNIIGEIKIIIVKIT